MPDLNLIDEGGFEETPAPVAPPAKKKSSSGGGSGLKILLLVVIVLILGGTVFFLNQRGIIKLWGKKKPAISQLQEEPFPPELTPEQLAQEQAAMEQQQADTAIALLETTPIDEKAAASSEPQAEPTESSEMSEEGLAEGSGGTESASNLRDMKGEFTIQVVAYREKRKAAETSKNLEIAGYPSFVEKVPMRDGDWYTVRIGRYPSRNAAQKAVKNFAAQLQAHYVIDKIRGK